MFGALAAAACARTWIGKYPPRDELGDEKTTPPTWLEMTVPSSNWSNPSCVSPAPPVALRNDSRSEYVWTAARAAETDDSRRRASVRWMRLTFSPPLGRFGAEGESIRDP